MTPEEEKECNTLKQEIYLATVALQGHRVDSTPSVESPLPTQLTIMQHVVNLLVTGTPPGHRGADKDSHAARIIAVMGTADKDNTLQVVLVVQNTHPTSPKQLDIQKLTTSADPRQLLRRMYTSPIDMPNYFNNVFTILHGFQNGELSRDDALLFNGVVFRHAYPKIASRIIKFNKLWKPEAHPIFVLEQLQPSSLKGLSSSLSIKVDHFVAVPLRNDYGVPLPQAALDTPKYKCTVSLEDIPKWVQAFTSAYRKLEKELLNVAKNGVRTSPFRSKDITAIMETIFVWKIFLSSEFLQTILRIALPSNSRVDEIDQSIGGDEYARDQLALAVVEDLELTDETSVTPDDLKTADESQSSYIIRIWKTIFAFTGAIDSITGRLQKSGQALEAHLITLPLPTTNDDGDALTTQLTEQIAERVDEELRDSATTWLSARLDSGLRRSHPRVHAKAALMGFAYAASLCATDPAAADGYDVDEGSMALFRRIFQVPKAEVAIGISKKCCWCCWQLYLWLRGEPRSSRPACPNLQLLGTHSIIYPWTPPAYIPLPFLRMLSGQLRQILADAAQVKGIDQGSHQTSARPSEELPGYSRHLLNAMEDMTIAYE